MKSNKVKVYLQSFVKIISEYKYLFLLVLLLSIIIPPFQSPDELSHFQRAYQVSYGAIFNQVSEEGVVGGFYPVQFEDIDRSVSNLYYNTSELFKYELLIEFLDDDFTDSDSNFRTSSANVYSATNYVFPAVAIAVGRVLNAPPLLVYYLARLIAAFAAVFIFAVACKIAPRARNAILVVFFMPMTLFQLVSTNADSFAISLAVLFTAYNLSLLTKEKLLRNDIVILTIISTLLVVTKNSYMPLLILNLLQISKFRSYRYKFSYFVTTVVLPTIVSLMLFIYSIASAGAGKEHIGNGFGDIGPSLLLAFGKDFVIDVYLMSSFYVETFIGRIGWLDTPMPFLFSHVPYLFLLLIAGVYTYDKYKNYFSRFNIAVILSTVLSFILLQFFLLYLLWFRIGHNIFGAQGRYFIPIAICLMLLLGIFFSPIISIKQRHFPLYLKLSFIFSSIILVLVIFERYYINF